MTTAMIDPDRYAAALFDLDGVVTDTASVHAAAWAEMLDDFLGERPADAGEDHRPFTASDYLRYVDGKPRQDGVATFLESRGVHLPLGDPSDPPETETVYGLGHRKDLVVQERLAEGVRVFASTVSLVRALQDAGVATAVFSASRNCAAVLQAAGLGDLFEVRVDGVVADDLGLAGKPDPATLLEAARQLDADPARTVVVEDALAGVEAGRRGGFGLVVGVDRTGQADALRACGADVVVADLAALEVGRRPLRPLSRVPTADEALDDFRDLLVGGRLAVFLDFDGALSPIVDQPDAAVPADGAPEALARLASYCPVAIVSGRDLTDVRRRVAVEGIWYAGSHGFQLAGPSGETHEYEVARAALPALDAAESELRARLGDVPGAIVERKTFSVTSHYRMVDPGRREEVLAVVDDVAAHHTELRPTRARMAGELVPDLEWNKGYAVRWLLSQVSPPEGRLTPVYAGDDLTDEDAMTAIRDIGLAVVVRSDEHGDRPTAAHLAVESPAELVTLLDRIADVLESEGVTR